MPDSIRWACYVSAKRFIVRGIIKRFRAWPPFSLLIALSHFFFIFLSTCKFFRFYFSLNYNSIPSLFRRYFPKLQVIFFIWLLNFIKRKKILTETSLDYFVSLSFFFLIFLFFSPSPSLWNWLDESIWHLAWVPGTIKHIAMSKLLFWLCDILRK